MKHTQLLFIVVASLSSSFAHSQSNSNALYEVDIYKWSKTGNVDNQKTVGVDSLGNIFIDGDEIHQQVNMLSFTKGINDFVQKEKVEKIEANDDPPREVFVPANNKQCVYITITYLKDYHAKNDFITKTQYCWFVKNLNKDDNNYSFYKYLDAKDIQIIKKLLTPGSGGAGGDSEGSHAVDNGPSPAIGNNPAQ